ncbi:hypothetical protein Tco_0656922 [Tanacetum coccineum]|uniref:Zinc finger, CCHC-type n=1 Tax=Tanacetum coccineum TaxID=301880 RepID=A0ABQ4XAV0_9ASTR
MGDENPIRTLGDYSKPSHNGYMNTIELPVGINMVPLRSDTISLVQNGCLFHGLWFEDPNQHLKEFLKLMELFDLDGENRERTRLHLFQFSLCDQASNWLERLPAGSITTWEDLTTYHVDCTTQMGIDYAAGGRLRKLRPDEAWATIKRLAHYEDVGWNDAFIPVEMSLNYKNPDIEQLLGIMERKVNTLMKDVISLIGRSKRIFRMTTNEMYRPPSEPSRQEEFEHIVMNFILDSGRKSQAARRIYESDSFLNSIRSDLFSGPQWGNLFPVNEPVYQELVREFFTSFEFDASPYRYDPNHLGVRFRLGGEQKEISLLELGWRVGLYSKRQSRENATLSGLRNGDTVKESHLLMEFWPTIRDEGFNVGNTKVASIRDPRVKLAHRCITMTITGRKETTHRVTEIDLYYLYCIYTPEVACNIPYWLSKYLKGVRDKNLIYGRMLVTRIARSFGLLTNELRDALSIEPPPHVFKKKSLTTMGVIMKLQNGMCVWPAPRALEEEEAEEEAEGDARHGGVGGSADIYRNMSQGD